MLDNTYDKKSTPPEPENLNGAQADNDTNTAATPRASGDVPRFVAPTHSGVDILKLLTELEDLVENTRRGPLGMMMGFNEDKFHMTVMKIRANLPEEMKRASKLAKDSERIVDEARETASQILQEARQSALHELEKGRAQANKLQDDAKQTLSRAQEEARAEVAHLREEAYAEVTQLRESASAEAEKITAEARKEAAQLVDDHEIIRLAQADAQDVQARAEQEADAMRRGAEDYARELLTNLETVLGKATIQVQRGREMLEQSR